MSAFIVEFEMYFKKNRDYELALSMGKYMRNNFKFLGINATERRKISKKFIKEYGDFEIVNIKEDIVDIWNLEEREFQYIYLDFLKKKKKYLTVNDLLIIEYIITNKSWWDTVDMIASHLVGEIFKNNKDVIDKYQKKWQESGNIWLQRALIIYQLNYKENTDKERLFQIIRNNLNTNEFFIDKAIGWALRQYSKTNKEEVIKFIKNTNLSKLSVREGSKYI
jgi:3-methyladenine DNA glycosylase AlkD